ncbi:MULTISPECIES: SWIM zinc finger family protein [unclassified Paenibacillus]|uniref:SWIM zinc finger family protein n=1 Tax=unclassified Paenibacillus TaxID=185978 RepID=UPI001AE5D675|nr:MULTISPECIES: SWIM zinc finger family protein [unclassified Paenibacillus]MBP1153419.1 putative Zn finger protein [Paenibacillus sp. PvP091]MBP1171198.1 putative Zn finger protein [Paenibacillus sp. PvR098]MBP2442226.1 putative Zn finger protein [Paenibacillus sp. PvP052]
MLKLQIPKNRIKELTRHLQSDFELAQLERGWEYFHKGRVTEIELKHGVEVHALVRGTKAYEVILDMDNFGKSECSCPDGENCKHMAAVVFALYAPYARPELLLQQLKQAILVRSRQQQTRTVTRAAEKRQQDRLDPPTANESPAQWQRFFEQQFYGFSLSQQHSIELFHSAAKEKLAPYGERWKSPLKELYALHLLLFIMRKIEQFYQETKTSYLSYYIETGCKTVGRQCQEDLLRLTPKLDVDALTQSYAAQWKETLSLISEAALPGKDSPLSWPTVYRSVWWRMTNHASWIAEERARLQRMLKAKDLRPKRKDALLMAEAHFAVIEGNDEAARQQMEQLSKREARDFFLYLHHCYEEQAWDRMLAWLRWLLPVVQRAQQEELRQFCQYWMEAVGRQTDDAEWVSVMVALLPRTYHFYTAYLLKAQRYKAWIDLQLSNRVSPMNLYSLDLQTVEKQDPALMLPLYHHAVERCIAEKNRTAYKSATNMLKKLNTLYKKLDRLKDWEDYIYRLTVKYSRLRALQEELRKGKWIP